MVTKDGGRGPVGGRNRCYKGVSNFREDHASSYFLVNGKLKYCTCILYQVPDIVTQQFEMYFTIY